jgi:hypothetical protein
MVVALAVYNSEGTWRTAWCRLVKHGESLSRP